ncbi:MAG: NAD-dependent epimerase/dehydratase family protein [Sphingomicrobium sp.]
MQRILVTGTASFIGYHLAELLLAAGFQVHGFDGLTDYYDVLLRAQNAGCGHPPFPKLALAFVLKLSAQ